MMYMYFVLSESLTVVVIKKKKKGMEHVPYICCNS